MNATLIDQILQLTVLERIQLVEDVWDSIASAPDFVELTDAQKQELDRRLEMHHKNDSSGSTWEEVKQRIGNIV